MPLTDLHQSKRGIAVAITCLVQTLNETDPTFERRFLDRLEAAYYELRDHPTGKPPGSDKNDHEALESLNWIRELLTGHSIFTGPGEPFLPHYEPKG